jgi:hypothetical protein
LFYLIFRCVECSDTKGKSLRFKCHLFHDDARCLSLSDPPELTARFERITDSYSRNL